MNPTRLMGSLVAYNPCGWLMPSRTAVMTTVASIENIQMHKKKKEENVLEHKWSISELKVRAWCAHLHLLLPINQPLRKAQSLILHWQSSCDVCHTA